ncbi:hypothetical protein CB0940_12139 [Cercospora beticola]|uniref:Uncharacterized protein n=1 Tax=Cercospora beticola TaxID=122368 RepID=A0A2G5GIC8_CERBT|nr:hypothetical protein CB0940_12139 [Cercospora beticola]PIA80039.1 hypothetical protein CB0940_12139 [Cercospora beticola]WPB07637.1 hypothetical protein RHO25_012298 [Cercospora beticola]CAK1356561.1 unnamed protein product [Cercospora beticola]
MQIPLSPATAVAIMLAAFAPGTQAAVKHDMAIIAYRGASLGDCEYSLLHENSLGGNQVTASKFRGRRAICTNDAANGCDASLIGWKATQCVERIDVYYNDGQAPDTAQVFVNSHGLCQYRAYSDNAGGQVNRFDACFCSDVGIHDNC